MDGSPGRQVLSLFLERCLLVLEFVHGSLGEPLREARGDGMDTEKGEAGKLEGMNPETKK